MVGTSFLLTILENKRIFKEKLIYLINYGDNDKMEYSTCEIKSIYNDNYVLEEACLSSLYSSGCPILNSLNLKVIGIQKMVEKKGKSIGVSIKTSIEKFKEKMNTLNSNRGNPEIYIKQKKNGKKKKNIFLIFEYIYLYKE